MIIARRFFYPSFVLILLSLLLSTVSAQPGKGGERGKPPGFFEKVFLSDGDSIDCYLAFRIPFDKLIFVKNGDLFSSGVKIDLEIKNRNGLIDRKSYSKSTVAINYEESKSKSRFLEGFIKIKIDDGDYVIYPVIQIGNVKESFKLDSVSISAGEIKKGNLLHPVIVESLPDECINNGSYRLVNNSNSIPFAPNDYLMIIPLTGSPAEVYSLKILQKGKTLFHEESVKPGNGKLSLSFCNDAVVISDSNTNRKTNYIIVKGFNKKLDEGPVEIIIESDGKEEKFIMSVDWLNKPFTLFNPVLSAELLEIIYSREELLPILKSSNDEKYEALIDFWDKKLPGREYRFNELMNEFYSRADYAAQNFSTIANPAGARTDRGKIFIRFGSPDEIKRDYSSGYGTVEIWYYYDLKKEFIFTDKTGLGNYILSK